MQLRNEKAEMPAIIAAAAPLKAPSGAQPYDTHRNHQHAAAIAAARVACNNRRDTTPDSDQSGSATSRGSSSKNGSPILNSEPYMQPRKYVSSGLSTITSFGSGTSLSSGNYSIIQSGDYQFIVFDAPTDHSVDRIVEDLKSLNCRTVVRVSHETYNPKAFTQNDIEVTSLFFPDGSMPSKSIIKKWLAKVSESKEMDEGPIGIHCVAGLGRSPLLVAIALIELTQLSAEQSIGLIRNNRRGAINRKQEEFIKSYEKEMKKRKSADKCVPCSIM